MHLSYHFSLRTTSKSDYPVTLPSSGRRPVRPISRPWAPHAHWVANRDEQPRVPPRRELAVMRTRSREFDRFLREVPTEAAREFVEDVKAERKRLREETWDMEYFEWALKEYGAQEGWSRTKFIRELAKYGMRPDEAWRNRATHWIYEAASDYEGDESEDEEEEEEEEEEDTGEYTSDEESKAPAAAPQTEAPQTVAVATTQNTGTMNNADRKRKASPPESDERGKKTRLQDHGSHAKARWNVDEERWSDVE